MVKDAARVLKVSIDDLKVHDTRPPLEEVKRATEEDPRYALAFRRVIDSRVSPDDLLKLAKDQSKPRKKS
jgi:hypothetical protein